MEGNKKSLGDIEKKIKEDNGNNLLKLKKKTEEKEKMKAIQKNIK